MSELAGDTGGPCPSCNGEGVVFEDRFSHATGHYSVEQPCTVCEAADVAAAAELAALELAAELRRDQELFG